MKKICSSAVLFVTIVLSSCSSEPAQIATHDTTSPINTSASAPPLTRFEPDANWTTPTETVSQYGPAGIVRDVVIDHNGTIWLATWDGIVSYDGKQFTNHTLKEGLSHHRVYSVMEDSKGNIWFGTMGAGAYKYDGTGFTNLSTNNGMISNVVFDLFEDASGNTWFATPKGVSRYDGKTFLNFDSTNSLHAEVYAISQDAYGTMWFGGEGGLFRYNPSQNDTSVTEVLTEQGTHYANVRDLYCDAEGVLWIGAARGLYKNGITQNSYNRVASVNSDFTGYIHPDRRGHLLLTTNAILRFDGARYDTLTSQTSSLGVFGANEAADGTTWYGAMDGLHSVKDGKDVSYRKP